jgi:hypothetical protein
VPTAGDIWKVLPESSRWQILNILMRMVMHNPSRSPAASRRQDYRLQVTKPSSYVLTYDVRGKKGSVSYVVANDGSARFTFIDTNGATTNETYSPRPRGPGGNDRPPPPPSTTPGREPTAAQRRANVVEAKNEKQSAAVDRDQPRV